MAEYETILIDKQDGVTTIRFNRPEKRNAMNPRMHREMYQALSDLEFDPDTRVLEVAAKLKAKDPAALRACKEAFKAVSPTASYSDAWYWLSAKVDQLTYQQKGGWVEQGIGKFLQKEYRPGLGSVDLGG